MTIHAPIKEQSFIKGLMLNEMYFYVDLQHKKGILDTIWQLAQSIYHKKVITIQYKLEQQNTVKEHHLQPLGIYLLNTISI